MTQRPRVLLVVDGTGLGGMEIHVARLAQALGSEFELYGRLR